MSFDLPVLLLVFNRPDVTAEAMEALRQLRPRRLFVAADGPRPGSESDPELCRRTRQIAANPHWKCEIKTLFQDGNLGCGRGPSTAISWFFDEVEAGIILEDDCVPNRSFFDFCAYLLNKYQDEERVGTIGGNFFLPSNLRMQQPYYFSKYLQAWGWATWRRTWKHYRFDLSFVSEEEWNRICRENCATRVEEEYWRFVIRALSQGIIDDVWDFQLLLIGWREKQLHVAPPKNLVRNLGFRPDATHTVTASPLARISTEELDDYRGDVEMKTMPDIDSITFYVRFLDSLASPWWLQQAIALDEHLTWVADQYRNLAQGVAGLRGVISQSKAVGAAQSFEGFAARIDGANQELASGRDRLLAFRRELAGAIEELQRVKQRLDERAPLSDAEPVAQEALLGQGVAGLLRGLRGFKILVSRE